MGQALVLDSRGRALSPCPVERANQLLLAGRATRVADDPLTIQLTREVDRPAPGQHSTEPPLQGRRMLLHTCCAPCATYSVQHLRELGAGVTALWFNPNVQPYSEHERRRQALEQYAQAIDLPVIWEPGYEMPAFFAAVVGHERVRQRCRLCYALRLERTAQRAAELRLDAFCTTLLISPYQDLAAIRQIGEALAARHGVAFYYENLRSGFAEHHRLAQEHQLYQQRYCGCVYSEWEALDRGATTAERPRAEQHRECPPTDDAQPVASAERSPLC